jgi:adenosylcobinamide-GDP ribazoletransferase
MLTSFLAALRQLSLLPPGPPRRPAEGREGEVIAFYPLAGLAVAAVPALTIPACRALGLGSPLCEALSLAALAVVTGLRPSAALARVAGAAASGLPPAEAAGLLHPRESGGGAGAAAVLLALLVKYSALGLLLNSSGHRAAFLAILLVVPAARWAATLVACYSNRQPGGSPLEEQSIAAAGPREARWALVGAILVCALLALLGVWQLGPLAVCAPLVACTALGWAGTAWCERRLGGASADCLGATSEIGEALALAAVCLLAPGAVR